MDFKGKGMKKKKQQTENPGKPICGGFEVTRRNALALGALAAVGACAASAQTETVRKPVARPHGKPCKWKVSARTDLPGTVIVDASDFVSWMPRDQRLVHADTAGAPWLYNNTGLLLRDMINFHLPVEIPESGEYHLFVRSMGTTGFRVGVGDEIPHDTFGAEPLCFKKGGTFTLKKGTVNVSITRISGGGASAKDSIFDALVLTRNPGFAEQDLKQHQLPEDVELIKEFNVPDGKTFKFGDVTGDGKADMMALGMDWSVFVYDHDGNELWNYKTPEFEADKRGRFEAPGTIWDFDQDGRAEVLHWRMIDGKEYLVLSEGSTGKIIRKTEWPSPYRPHLYRNYKTAVVRLHEGYPCDIIVMSDGGYGGDGRTPDVIRQTHPATVTFTAYDHELNQLWQHREARARDHFGHYMYPRDINGDGLDEIMIGHMMLSSRGEVLWSHQDLFEHNYDHVDSIRWADVDGDGEAEVITSTSDIGVMARKARTGEILWRHNAEHGQQVEVGDFLDFAKPPHVAVTARFYGKDRTQNLSSQIHWFDADGNLVKRWPGNPIEGNLDAVKGNWKGDGQEALFWDRFRMGRDGTGKLYVPDSVYHMFDFTGDGADEIITRGGGVLRVYGSKSAKRVPGFKHDPDYLRHKMANHTHY